MQQAMLQFMPALDWDFEKAYKYAEKAWFKLSEKGYGDTAKQGPREIPKAYDQLKKYPTMLAAFDLFWLAFDYKQGKDRAAARWLQMGAHRKSEYDAIIAAAKREAAARKNLPDGRVPKMAEGWLTERRWLDTAETHHDQAEKQKNQKEQQLRQVNQDLAHAKRMAADTGDEYWQSEAEKLTEKLRTLRDAHD